MRCITISAFLIFIPCCEILSLFPIKCAKEMLMISGNASRRQNHSSILDISNYLTEVLKLNAQHVYLRWWCPWSPFSQKKKNAEKSLAHKPRWI